MRIAILSFIDSDDSLRVADKLIKRAAIARGHAALIYRNPNITLTFNGEKDSIYYRDHRIATPDILITRPYLQANVDLGISTAKQFQTMGIPVFNDYLSIARCKNKVRMTQFLKTHGIPIPKTMVVYSRIYLKQALEAIGNFPIIVKTPTGSFGFGVVLIESKRSFQSFLDMYSADAKDQPLLIQEYIGEAKGRDIRVFVIGNTAVAAMERIARKGEFRSNFSIGGKVALTELSSEEIQLCVRAAEALGCDVAGVDMIRTKDGPKIIEVNCNPGFEGIVEATKVNIPDLIIEHAERKFQIASARSKRLLKTSLSKKFNEAAVH